MKKHWKAIAIVAVILIGLGWLLVDGLQEHAAMTASASGTVLASEFDPDEESSSLDETDIEYEFSIGDRLVRASTSVPGDRVADYPPGQTIQVCYNPQEETSSRINSGGACGG